MALGADRGSVVRTVLARVFVILSIGLALGALLSSGTGPAVSSLVLGVPPDEPVLVIAIVGLLAVIALVSCAGPVRRSLGVDPLTALREE
jgi:ABC-type antimicrobial peptide transport system permease subunit